jgi:hypothetical protein
MNGLGAQAYAQNATAIPRELGVLARVEGISSGLYELQQKLTNFADKLAGQGLKDTASGQPPSPGITGTLSAAEARLRECHQLVDVLHKAF